MLHKRLLNRGWLVLGSMVLVTLIVTIYSLAKPYAYEAPGLVPKKVEISVDRPASPEVGGFPTTVFQTWCGCIVEKECICKKRWPWWPPVLVKYPPEYIQEREGLKNERQGSQRL